jgi:hypothetical protein
MECMAAGRGRRRSKHATHKKKFLMLNVLPSRESVNRTLICGKYQNSCDIASLAVSADAWMRELGAAAAQLQWEERKKERKKEREERMQSELCINPPTTKDLMSEPILTPPSFYRKTLRNVLIHSILDTGVRKMPTGRK